MERKPGRMMKDIDKSETQFMIHFRSVFSIMKGYAGACLKFLSSQE